MADPEKTSNGGNAGHTTPQVQAQIVGQYIKDLSFENPGIGKPIKNKEEAPNLEVQINVNAKRLSDDHFESAIEFKALATNSSGTIYDLELIYAGLFKLKNVPTDTLDVFLLIHCPTLVFPFLRRLVADLTREGGFPPLLLDPIDFAALYAHNQKQSGASDPNLTN
ncbi:MAG: protein-export chaperone SecB [Alphaproteobacteria bacterium]|nr:protein-export chaperone SecB [Alphaproteobacteria bacterium]